MDQKDYLILPAWSGLFSLNYLIAPCQIISFFNSMRMKRIIGFKAEFENLKIITEISTIYLRKMPSIMFRISENY